MSIKNYLKSLENSRFGGSRFFFHCIKLCQLGAIFLSDGRYRSETMMPVLFKNRCHQLSTLTFHNRFPNLFKTCGQYLVNNQNPHILSFGCSTGEEVFSIGERIPNAIIVGVDINYWCLRQCRKKDKNSAYLFIHTFSKKFKQLDRFDAIFCLSVFQRTENRTSQNNTNAQGFLFNQFEDTLQMLDRKLKPGGLIIIDQADFNFLDTDCSKGYSPLMVDLNQIKRDRPLFNQKNEKVADLHNSYRIFVKL
jgi:hypothetical protein